MTQKNSQGEEPSISLDAKSYTHAELYKLMTGLVVPRPIALVSTLDGSGVRNLAPFSFFTGVGSNPPTLLFCPALRDGEPREKDTLRNVEATREFVVNVVDEALAERMNLCAAEVGPEVDEFALAGLTPLASESVRPCRVAESPAQMECRLLQVVRTGTEAGSGVIVLGEILRFHLRRDILEGRYHVDADRLKAIGRMSGRAYTRTHDRFELTRPR